MFSLIPVYACHNRIRVRVRVQTEKLTYLIVLRKAFLLLAEVTRRLYSTTCVVWVIAVKVASPASSSTPCAQVARRMDTHKKVPCAYANSFYLFLFNETCVLGECLCDGCHCSRALEILDEVQEVVVKRKSSSLSNDLVVSISR